MTTEVISAFEKEPRFIKRVWITDGLGRLEIEVRAPLIMHFILIFEIGVFVYLLNWAITQTGFPGLIWIEWLQIEFIPAAGILVSILFLAFLIYGKKTKLLVDKNNILISRKSVIGKKSAIFQKSDVLRIEVRPTGVKMDDSKLSVIFFTNTAEIIFEENLRLNEATAIIDTIGRHIDFQTTVVDSNSGGSAA